MLTIHKWQRISLHDLVNIFDIFTMLSTLLSKSLSTLHNKRLPLWILRWQKSLLLPQLKSQTLLLKRRRILAILAHPAEDVCPTAPIMTRVMASLGVSELSLVEL